MSQEMTTGQAERPAPETARVDGAANPAAEVEELFVQHHLRLLRALYLLTGSAAEAEDLLQEAFVKVWQRWDRVRTMNDQAGYLYRTAMNAFRSRWRHRLVELRHQPKPASSSDAIESATERQAVLEALRRVPPRQRLAVVLADFLDRSPAEVASVLGVEEATARSLASQGRARVRRELETADG